MGGTSAYLAQIYAAEQASGVPHGLLAGLVAQESGGNPGATGFDSGGSVDRGIVQINSQAHPQVSDAQAYDPAFAIPWAASQLASLKTSTGTWTGALEAYNSGSAGGAPGYATSVMDKARAYGYGPGTAPVAPAAAGGSAAGTSGTAPSVGTARWILLGIGLAIALIALLRVL